MSLSVALNNALSGLRISQSGIELTSRNVGNANTPGYVRKTLQYESTTYGGVLATGIERQVTESLLREYRASRSAISGLEATDRYLSQLSGLLGTPSEGGRISRQISALSEAFESLSVDPAAYETVTEARDRLSDMARTLREGSDGVQDLRAAVDLDIAGTISEINRQLNRIHDLNDRILLERSRSGAIQDLEDSRDEAIRTLSEQIPVTTFTQTNGRIAVSTVNGLPLVDDRAHLLKPYSGNAPVSPLREFSVKQPPLSPTYFGESNFEAIAFEIQPNVDLTTFIKGGKLGSLIHLRDVALPTVQEQFDNLASVIKDQLNRQHNLGTSAERTGTITGSRQFADPAVSTVTVTGDVRFVVLREDGSNLGNFTLPAGGPVPISGVGSLTDTLQTQLNALAAGLTFTVSAAANGGLTISVPNDPAAPNRPLRLAMVELAAGTDTPQEATVTYDINGAAAGGTETVQGFSSFFGLNDLFVTDGRSPAYRSVGTFSTADVFPIGTGFTVAIPTAAAEYTFASAGSRTIEGLADEINADVQLDAWGVKASVFRTGEGFGLRIGRSVAAVPGVPPADILITGGTGLDLTRAEVGSAANIDLREDIAGNPRLIARGRPEIVDPALAPGAPSPYYALSSGDATVAKQLSDAFTQTFTFRSVAGLQSMQATLSGYSAQIVGYVSTTTAQSNSALETEQYFAKTVQDRFSNETGVNIDQELSDLIRLQFMYNASARVVNVVRELFGTLESILN